MFVAANKNFCDKSRSFLEILLLIRIISKMKIEAKFIACLHWIGSCEI